MENELPQWIQYVAGAISLIVVGVVSRLGWKSNSPPQSQTAEIAGAIIDNRAAKEITAAISAASERHHSIQSEMIELVRAHNNEVRVLHQEIRELSREIMVARSRAT